MASKITASALHPEKKIALALAIFHETTTEFKFYMPARKDAVEFLTLLSSWRGMINNKQRYNPNALGNAIVSDDGKIDFFSLLQNGLKTGVIQQDPLFAYLSNVFSFDTYTSFSISAD